MEKKASKEQIGGDHYKNMKIQPVDFCMKNNLDFCQSSAIKYICRFRNKNGIEDLKKAKHFIDLLIEFEYPYEDPIERAEKEIREKQALFTSIGKSEDIDLKSCYDTVTGQKKYLEFLTKNIEPKFKKGDIVECLIDAKGHKGLKGNIVDVKGKRIYVDFLNNPKCCKTCYFYDELKLC